MLCGETKSPNTVLLVKTNSNECMNKSHQTLKTIKALFDKFLATESVSTMWFCLEMQARGTGISFNVFSF